jgi:hypothetical protein
MELDSIFTVGKGYYRTAYSNGNSNVLILT